MFQLFGQRRISVGQSDRVIVRVKVQKDSWHRTAVGLREPPRTHSGLRRYAMADVITTISCFSQTAERCVSANISDSIISSPFVKSGLVNPLLKEIKSIEAPFLSIERTRLRLSAQPLRCFGSLHSVNNLPKQERLVERSHGRPSPLEDLVVVIQVGL